MKDKNFVIKVFKPTGGSADNENRPAADIYRSERWPHASSNFATYWTLSTEIPCFSQD